MNDAYLVGWLIGLSWLLIGSVIVTLGGVNTPRELAERLIKKAEEGDEKAQDILHKLSVFPDMVSYFLLTLVWAIAVLIWPKIVYRQLKKKFS